MCRGIKETAHLVVGVGLEHEVCVRYESMNYRGLLYTNATIYSHGCL